MDKNKIIGYVLNTPENTNPNILRQMLDNMSGSDGGGVLVAHASVDVSSFSPGQMYEIAPDKTLAELKEAEFSALSIDMMSEGELSGSYIMPLYSNSDETLVYSAHQFGDGTNIDLYATVMDDDGETYGGFLMTVTSSSGN